MLLALVTLAANLTEMAVLIIRDAAPEDRAANSHVA